jgi:hypothetical protein
MRTHLAADIHMGALNCVEVETKSTPVATGRAHEVTPRQISSGCLLEKQAIFTSTFTRTSHKCRSVSSLWAHQGRGAAARNTAAQRWPASSTWFKTRQAKRSDNPEAPCTQQLISRDQDASSEITRATSCAATAVYGLLTGPCSPGRCSSLSRTQLAGVRRDNPGSQRGQMPGSGRRSMHQCMSVSGAGPLAAASRCEGAGAAEPSRLVIRPAHAAVAGAGSIGCASMPCSRGS